MKAIQITIDDELLARLDSDEQVKRLGRSAVLRRAVDAYLRRSQRARIADRYRQAYADQPGLGAGFAGWDEEGVWPER